MQRPKTFATCAAILIFCAGIGSCSKSNDEGGDALASAPLLKYVPADTPYVMANTEPLPDDVMDTFEPLIDAVLKSYRTLAITAIDEGIAKAKSEGKSDDEIAIYRSVSDELIRLMSLEGLRGAGIGRESTSVIYGNGLLPVLRIELTDAALMESAIAKIEEAAGRKMKTAEIDNVKYRVAGEEDDGNVIIALVNNDLVITALPAAFSDESLKTVLGLSLPQQNIADSGALAVIASENDYEPYFLALIDTVRIASTFLDEQSGVNGELLAQAEYDPTSLSNVCKSEIREMAAVVPRMFGGYTEFTPTTSSGSFVVELRDDIAAGLQTLVAPVPGLGIEEGDLFAFGMSFDLAALREFYSARLDAIEENPYECEHFAELQRGADKGRAALQQPVPPVVYSLKGFLAVVDAIDGFDFATKQPPTSVDASFLVSIDNPQALVAMGAMFSPELAELDLQPDGKPVRLDLPPVSPAMQNAFVAMTDSALVLSVGDEGEARLSRLLAADFADPAPFMSLNMDAASYYRFVSASVQHGQADDQEASPEMTKAIADIMNLFGEMLGRQAMDVNFTERGVEIVSSAEITTE